jgi:tRNA pseudouridine55 synthase
MATGFLLVATPDATRFFPYIPDEPKVYRATLKFGVATTTLDAQGQITEQGPVPNEDQGPIEQQLDSFLGEFWQEAPLFSAKKVDGIRLYERAHQGLSWPEGKRPGAYVKVFQTEIIAWNKPFLEFRVHVSKGTYIRSLAESLAHKLGTVGHLVALRREATGFLSVTHATPWSLFSHECIRPADEVLQSYPSVMLESDQAIALCQGKTTTSTISGIARVYAGPLFLGLARGNEGTLRSERFLPTQDLLNNLRA